MNPLLRLTRKPGFFRRQTTRVLHHRSQSLLSGISEFLDTPAHILDVGSGSCHVTQLLQQRNHIAVPLDVTDLSLVEGLRPVIYNGHMMPFETRSFDLALLLFTLHHTPDPRRVLAETARVSKRIIVMEDIYKNTAHKYATWSMDSLLNLEFSGHPHTNKSDQKWRALFDILGMRLIATKQAWAYGVMLQGTYYLENQ